MVLGKLLVPGRPTNLDYSRARKVRVGVVWTFFFSRLSFLSSFSLSLWEILLSSDLLLFYVLT